MLVESTQRAVLRHWGRLLARLVLIWRWVFVSVPHEMPFILFCIDTENNYRYHAYIPYYLNEQRRLLYILLKCVNFDIKYSVNVLYFMLYFFYSVFENSILLNCMVFHVDPKNECAILCFEIFIERLIRINQNWSSDYV